MLVRAMLSPLLSVLLASVASFAGGLLAAQEKALQRTVTEKSLGRVDLSNYDKKAPTFWVSPNGKHAAWLVAKNKIAIDGQVREYKNDLTDKSFRFSPDGEHWGYAVYIPDKGDTVVVDGVEQKTGYNQILYNPFFSPDGKHVAYFASQYKGGDMLEYLVLDGKESPPHDDATRVIYFTPDSKRVMYAAEIGGKKIFRTQTIEGKEPPSDLTLLSRGLNTVFFGPGGQIGYIGSAGEDQSFVFYDGQEDGLKFDEIKRDIVFSDDGKHIAYIAEPGSFDDVAVIGGKASKVFSGFEDILPGTLALSPDGSRSAYSVKKSREQHVVLDGEDSKPYPRVGGAVFSPDSKHVAWQASASGKLFNVVDGREGQPYDKLGMPQFSPDSSTVAYWAEAGGKQFIVVNGQKQKAFDSVGTPVFATSSKRLVYLSAESGGKWLLVDGGQEGTGYDDIDGTLYFSGDGQRLATIFTSGNEQAVVVDRTEGKRYDTIVTIAGGRLHFATGDKLHYLATKGDELLLVEETIAE